MSQFFVADIGNTRIKVGLVRDSRLSPDVISLPKDVEDLADALEGAVRGLTKARSQARPSSWLIASVDPSASLRTTTCLRSAGCEVIVFEDYRKLPFEVAVEKPETVGIDRLLSSFAVAKTLASARPAAIISAGTAVTVDLVDSAGRFRGGVIIPGFRLMALALHEHTAKLPLIGEFNSEVRAPGGTTGTAIQAGVLAAIAGGIDNVVEQYTTMEPGLRTILTGGDANLLTTLRYHPTIQPELVLKGLAHYAAGQT